MDEEGEEICLVTAAQTGNCRRETDTASSKRDYDSLNNLVFLESDAESIIADSRRDTNEDDGTSVSTKASFSMDCSCLENRKMMFKEEFSKHRNIVDREIIKGTRGTETRYKLNSKKSIWKSFISLCIGLLFAFMSFMPLRNIQTSLYSTGLANVALAAMYLSFAIGCLFSSWISQNARPKGIILVAIFGHVVFAAANIYPSLYTLLPASCFFGFFHAPLWTTQELLLASYGASYTAITRIGLEKSIQQFQSVFLIFCHAAQIFGNLLESAILHLGDYETKPINVTLHHSLKEYEAYDHIMIRNITERKTKHLSWVGPFGYRIEPNINYPGDKINYENVLKFVFLGLAALGMTVICMFLNKPDIIIHKKKSPLVDKMRDVGGFMTTGTFFFLVLLMLFSGMQQAVVICNVTKIYGTLTIGLSMVGYMMMCYGTCQLAVLLVVEKLQTRLKPVVAILNVFIITLGLLVWLYIGNPSPDCLYKIMGYVGLWGAVDGLWQSQVQSVLMASAMDRREPAVVCFRTIQSLGLVCVFLMDIWLPLLTQICIMGAILVFGVIFYMVLEVVRQPMTPSDPPPFSL